MSQIWFTSDLHFNHDREFIYKPRGFNSVYEMNEAIISNWNRVVNSEDNVFLLGDVMLGNNEIGIKMLKQLKGNIHIIRGNHDTDTRLEYYYDSWNVIAIEAAKYVKINGQNFFLCHYPTITSNLEKTGHLREHLINLYGHTHQKTNFYNDMPFCYHVGVDSHDCTPVSLEQILSDIRAERDKCLGYL